MPEPSKRKHERPKKDPRDISDKQGYQKEAKQNIIAFLVEKGYPHDVSPKKLSGPTQKEFMSMFYFITSFVVPGTSKDCPEGAEASDVIGVLKILRYPFAPAKSTLQAVSSPLYWPTILAMLDWLVQVAREQEACCLAEKENEPLTAAAAPGEQGAGKPDALGIALQGYASYRQGDEEGSVYRDLVQESMAAEVKSAEFYVEELAREKEQLMQQESLSTLEGNVEASKAEEAKLTAAWNDGLKQLQKQKEVLEEMEKTEEEMELELTRQQEAVREQLQQIAHLREQVAKQPMDRFQYEELRREREAVHRALSDREAHIGRVTDQRQEGLARLYELLTNVDAVVHDVNKGLSALQLVPATAARARGCDLELDLQYGSTDGEWECNWSLLKSTVMPILGELKVGQQEAIAAFLREAEETAQLSQSCAEGNRAREQELQATQDELQQLALREEWTQAQRRCEETMQQVDAIEAEVARDLEESDKELAAAQATLTWKEGLRKTEADSAAWEELQARKLKFLRLSQELKGNLKDVLDFRSEMQTELEAQAAGFQEWCHQLDNQWEEFQTEISEITASI